MVCLPQIVALSTAFTGFWLGPASVPSLKRVLNGCGLYYMVWIHCYSAEMFKANQMGLTLSLGDRAGILIVEWLNLNLCELCRS